MRLCVCVCVWGCLGEGGGGVQYLPQYLDTVNYLQLIVIKPTKAKQKKEHTRTHRVK